MIEPRNTPLVLRLNYLESRFDGTFDLAEQYRRLFEEYRKTNFLLDSAIKGETGIAKELYFFDSKFGGFGRLLPSYVSEEEKIRIRELGDLINHINLNNPKNKSVDLTSNGGNITENPLFVGMYLGGLFAVPAVVMDRHMSRRELLAEAVSSFAFFGGIGAAAGYERSSARSEAINLAMKAAISVDQKIGQAYPLDSRK